MGKQQMSMNEIEELLARGSTRRLGMCKDNQPYVVPVCFVYHDGKVFFHSARKGRKMDFMRANPTVCFQVDEHSLVSSSKPCKFTMNYHSVVAVGCVRFLIDSKEKLQILKMLVRKYAGSNLAELLSEKKTNRVEVGEITLTEISGKKND
jgi:nitroimidazol reductase NimA-like FMN-containing flavoprotein (pyridoxamine 5'-phosphate oxidase superfamily)